jgi:hypothetical protein
VKSVCRPNITLIKSIDLKNDKPFNWWKNLKPICGLDSCVDTENGFQHILYNSKPIDKSQLVNVINNFLDITRDEPPLDKTVAAVAKLVGPMQFQNN